MGLSTHTLESPTAPFEVEKSLSPAGWTHQPLSTLSSKLITYGIVQPGPHVPTGVPFIQTKDLTTGVLNPDMMDRTSQDIHAAYTRSAVTSGDIIVGIRASVGMVGYVPEGLHEANISRGVARVSPARHIDGRFLFYALQSAPVQTLISRESKGSTYSEITLPALRNIEVPVPPTRSEQEAIAKALGDADALIDSLEQLLAKKRDIKQGAMQELLTGKKRLSGFSGEWETKKLGDCLLCHPSYGINAPAVPYSDLLPTYIRITDVSDDGRFLPSPSVSVRSRLANQYFLEDGDLVFARTGASVGKSYCYRREDGPLVYAGFLIRIRPDPACLLPSYLSSYVTTKKYWDWVRLMSMRSGQPGINGNEYAQLPVFLPKVDEQAAISEILLEMELEMAAIEAKLAKIRQTKQGMMQELLTGRIRLV